jgi:hypothetical protein
MQSAKSVGFMPIRVGHGKNTPKPEQFDSALARAPISSTYGFAVSSKAVDKSKLN